MRPASRCGHPDPVAQQGLSNRRHTRCDITTSTGVVGYTLRLSRPSGGGCGDTGRGCGDRRCGCGDVGVVVATRGDVAIPGWVWRRRRRLSRSRSWLWRDPAAVGSPLPTPAGNTLGANLVVGDGQRGTTPERSRRDSGDGVVGSTACGTCRARGRRRGAGAGRDQLPAPRRSAGGDGVDRDRRGRGAAHPAAELQHTDSRCGAARHRDARLGRGGSGQGADRSAAPTGGGVPVRARRPRGRGVRDRRPGLPSQTGSGGPAGRGGHPVLRRAGRRRRTGPAAPAVSGGRRTDRFRRSHRIPRRRPASSRRSRRRR